MTPEMAAALSPPSRWSPCPRSPFTISYAFDSETSVSSPEVRSATACQTSVSEAISRVRFAKRGSAWRSPRRHPLLQKPRLRGLDRGCSRGTRETRDRPVSANNRLNRDWVRPPIGEL